ncbi:O-antigen ligase family protein [Marinobacter salinisoli]|uniref:O-antigen ligase family protein n=1 Tax=Marinobacter salinisoli TaxID=2769486 RepID=A0ABX7MN94_9GAMM|nr:O-antigen ligase family protein [Marinobacter salinisoli]QSP93673.1 O-antigen ligase family protein [Marinobacter salinisoli]
MSKKSKSVTIEDFYHLQLLRIWRYFRGESFAFWMICGYFFFEYFRPQSIYTWLDFLPWTQLTVLGALIGCFTDKTVRWVSSPINILIIAFFLIVLLSSYFAYWPSFSYEQLEFSYTWFIIYFLIINIVNTEKRFFIFLCIFFLASFKLSLSLTLKWAARGFSFTDWGLMGPRGFFQNSGELAIQMLVFWPLAWAFAHFLKQKVSKKWYSVLLMMPITAVMVVIGASSRGGQIALFLQLIVSNAKAVFRPRILISCALAVSVLWAILPDEQKERFENIGSDRTSIQRLLYWEHGIDMLNDHPFLGVGYFNFIPYYERVYREDMLYEYAELPHNIFIQVGSELGYSGLIVYVLMLAYCFWKTNSIRKKLKEEGEHGFFYYIFSYLNISLLGFIFAGQFVSVVYYPFLWIHLALFVALTQCVQTKKTSKKRPA